MSNSEKIKRFLQANKPQAYCDDCISKATKITPRNQVNQTTKAIAGVGGFFRGPGDCSACANNKIVINA